MLEAASSAPVHHGQVAQPCELHISTAWKEGLRHDGYRDQFQPRCSVLCLCFILLSGKGLFPLSSSWERLSYYRQTNSFEHGAATDWLLPDPDPSSCPWFFLHCFSCPLSHKESFCLKIKPHFKRSWFCKFPLESMPQFRDTLAAFQMATQA